MKTLKKSFILLVLTIIISCIASCKNNDNEDYSTQRIYPTEVHLIEVKDVCGILSYDNENQKWVINSLDFPLANGDEEGATLLVNNPSEEIGQHIGAVTYSGHVKHLYTDIHKLENGEQYYTKYYSLELSELKADSANGRSATNLVCKTPTSAPPEWIFSTNPRVISESRYTCNIFLHIIRSTAGKGLNVNSVSESIKNNLNDYFNNTNIDFHILGSEYIDSDVYLQYTDDKIDNLFNINPHNNAIDIYVLSKASGIKGTAGMAQGIPSTACFIHPSYIEKPTTVHEIGHCLGLYHTHHGTSTSESKNACPELVDGSNSDICGDYITDTPADPCLWSYGTYIGTITDAAGNYYTPDPTNFMSYSNGNRTKFTFGQISRMHTAITKEQTLQNTLHNKFIEGDSHFCSSAIYNISYLSKDETVSWKVIKFSPSSTAEDQALNSTTLTSNENILTLESDNQSNYYEIQAMVQSPFGKTTTAVKKATSHSPSPYTGVLSWETTDGQFGTTTNMSHGNTLYISGTKILKLEYLDKAGNSSKSATSEINFNCVTSANRPLSGSTLTLQTTDCKNDLKIRVINVCGASANFFTIPCKITSYSYNLSINNSILSINMEEIEKKSISSILSINKMTLRVSEKYHPLQFTIQQINQ